MELDERQRTIDGIRTNLDIYPTGYFVTLNTLTNDSIKFEETQIPKLSIWLNDFCYGNAWRRGEKSLRIVGASEVGDVNQGLHAHVVIMHNNDTNKTFEEINFFIRRKWYSLIGASGSPFGNMVNVQPISDLDGAIGYFSKTFYQQTNFHILYL